MRYLKWHTFNGQVMRILGLRTCALLVAVILSLPGISSAAGRAPWVLVDTESLTLTVFSSENHVLARFHNIAIGSGGAADLHRRGDETTPRGTFHIIWIDRHSRFGTFYGLDYPSAHIAWSAYVEGKITSEEFDAIIRALRQNRLPPEDTPLGGQLGIHGLGVGDPKVQQAVNWTSGCVAVTNRQIRQLARWMHVGTKVVIR
jgi:murein L,D-transpeptidase YafK